MSKVPLSSYHTLNTYHKTVHKLRTFFRDRGFIEVDTQSRKSILAACEDPKTVTNFSMAGQTWPLPQTGQMWLEHELLKNPEIPGLFCLTTSYRDEPNPAHHRYFTIFPLFEFETHGDVNVLQGLMSDLFEYLGFGPRESHQEGEYDDMVRRYNHKFIEAEQEERIWQDFGPVFFLKKFPFYSDPFFNMKKVGNHANKIDAILYGMETVGSAERSCDPDEMREWFHTISDGGYAALLYKHFGKERVDRELEEFFSLDFFTRCGGGIGMNRLMRAITLAQEDAQHPGVFAQQPQTQQMV